MTREEVILRMQEIGCYNAELIDRAEWKDGSITLKGPDGEFAFPAGGKLGDFVKADKAKAIQIGHCFYLPEILDKPLDESFDFANGKVVVLGEKNCMVCAALRELDALRAAGCGICTFCREGAYQLSVIFGAMTKPGADKRELDLAQEIASVMADGSNCPVGGDTALPVLSALALFRGELEAHCGGGKCPAGECSAFSSIYIDPYKCEGAGDCMDVCPVDAIEGKRGFISMIDTFECTKCGKCIEACENEAITFASGKLPKLPDKLTKVGRFRK